MKVYHGTNVRFEKIDLSKCHPNMDIKSGFHRHNWQEIYEMLKKELKQ